MRAEGKGDGIQDAGRRRRRLTLAPRPWSTARNNGQGAKVSTVVFADSDGGGSEAASVESWIGSSVGSSSLSPPAMAGTVISGSRFRALADDVSADEESESEEELRTAIDAGGSPSWRKATSGNEEDSTLVSGEDVPKRPKDCGCAKDNFKPVSHPKSMQWRAKKCKPWKGPLPPVHAAQSRSLGDFWDRRPGRSGVVAKFADFAQEMASSLPVGSLAALPTLGRNTGPRLHSNSNCEMRVPVSARLCGSALRALMGQEVQPCFRFPSFLLRQSGRPIGWPSNANSRASCRLPPTKSVASPSAMAGWLRDERWPWGGGDRKERAVGSDRRSWPARTELGGFGSEKRHESREAELGHGFRRWPKGRGVGGGVAGRFEARERGFFRGRGGREGGRSFGG